MEKMKKENKIRVIYKAPGHEPEWREVLNDLDSFQGLVNGYIECVPWDDRYLMIVNEEGKLRDMPGNFIFYGDEIAGPAVWVAKSGWEFASILDDKFLDEVLWYTIGRNLEDDEDDITAELDLEDLFRELMERGGRG